MFNIGDRVVVRDGSDLQDYVCEWNPHMSKFIDQAFTVCSIINFARGRVGYCFEELQNTEDSDYIFDERRLYPEGLVWICVDDHLPVSDSDDGYMLSKLVALDNGRFAVAVYLDNMWIDTICGLVYGVPNVSPSVSYWSEISGPIQKFPVSKQVNTQPMTLRTLEAAVDYLNEIGWLPEHDRVLTQGS